jgi:uracil-DNA glycosylase
VSILFNLDSLGAWRELPFFETQLPRIEAILGTESDFLPAADKVFAALEQTKPADVRVVIIGQDPYPTPGHAHGLAFSAEASVRPLPRSLGNIYREMRDDIGNCPTDANLRFWADQGVLLLNTILTVPPGQARGHAHLGWQRLTSEVLSRLSPQPRAYLLWGACAQEAARDVDPVVNLKIETAHPSPLSARRGFFGSRPFSRTNAWLQAQGGRAINWANPAEAA